MQEGIKKLIVKLLSETIDKINNGTCELSDEEAGDIMSVLSHQAMSKEDACVYLNCSRATFDNNVRLGILPKGRKRRGFKELVWYKDELNNVLKR